MRKLVALLLALALVIGLVPAAMAKSYTLDIYWIANVNNDVPEGEVTEEVAKAQSITEGVENAVNAYLAQLHKDKKIKEIQVKYHLITWDPTWTEVAIGDLLADKKIDLIFTADWEGYVMEIDAGKLTQLDDLVKSDGQGPRWKSVGIRTRIR